ncbi:DeoR family transcriptional regulator, partial [Klebsiella pneumoniae]
MRRCATRAADPDHSCLALVEQRGAVSINELTEILGVSHMTIRRDV